MATRARIGFEAQDGTIVSSYHHWDGYPAGNGRILQENYQDLAKIEALIALGSISSLGPELGEKQDFDDRSTQKDEWTLAYNRDRGEELHVSEYDDIPSWIDDMEEYAYLWNGREWLVNDHGAKDDNGFPVFDLLEVKIKTETARLKAAGYL